MCAKCGKWQLCDYITPTHTLCIPRVLAVYSWRNHGTCESVSLSQCYLASVATHTHTHARKMCEWQMGFMWWWLMCVWHMDESQNFRWMKCAIYHRMRHIRSRSFVHSTFFRVNTISHFTVTQHSLSLWKIPCIVCVHINMLKVKYFSNSMHKHSKMCYNFKFQQRMMTIKDHAYVNSYFRHSITLQKYTKNASKYFNE